MIDGSTDSRLWRRAGRLLRKPFERSLGVITHVETQAAKFLPASPRGGIHRHPITR